MSHTLFYFICWRVVYIDQLLGVRTLCISTSYQVCAIPKFRSKYMSPHHFMKKVIWSSFFVTLQEEKMRKCTQGVLNVKNCYHWLRLHVCGLLLENFLRSHLGLHILMNKGFLGKALFLKCFSSKKVEVVPWKKVKWFIW